MAACGHSVALTKDLRLKWTDQSEVVLQGLQIKCSWIEVDLEGGGKV